MSKPRPFTMAISEDGLSVRSEWDVHYVSDEEVKTVRRYVAHLKGENNRLREQGERLLDKTLELGTENAKLRELVRDMYACIGALCSMVENSPGCSMCPTNQDEERPCAAADVFCRMAELGVKP